MGGGVMSKDDMMTGGGGVQNVPKKDDLIYIQTLIWRHISLIFMIYGTDICEIHAIFGTYVLGAVLARSEGVQRYQNSLHFKFFPISVEGGVIENQFFPKFKKV